jgi:protease-4
MKSLSRPYCYMLFLLVGSLTLLGHLTTAVVIAQDGTTTEKTSANKTANKIAVITIPTVLTEAESLDEFSALFAGGEVGTFRSLIDKLAKAEKDETVAAVVLKADLVTLGPAQIEELRRLIDRIKAAGKPVYAHVDSLSMDQYVLLSGVSRLSLTPVGDVWITGIYSDAPYLRELLDKVGVEPDYLTCGAYKSAAETFTRTEPSVEAKENLEWLVDGLFSTYVRLISQGRNITPEKVRASIDQGLHSAQSALKEGLVDALEYHEDFVAYIKKTHGDTVQFDKRYGRAAAKSVDLSSPLGLIQFYADLLGGTKRTASNKDAVAIVYVEGPILVGSAGANPLLGVSGAYSTPIRAALDEAARDPHIKGVVLRIDSPGGSAVASEVILEATRRLKAVKPFVVSMGNVAGSGGYYVACGSDIIFAEETTITGSIGVVGGKLATRGLWKMLGIHWQAVSRGERAGMIYSADKFSAAERERLFQWMTEVYDAFKSHVVAIRGDRLKKDIDDLAGGRVYTGRQAAELGLVDRLGGLSDAIQYVAAQAGLQPGKYEVRSLPQPPSFLDLLLGESSQDDDPAVLQLRRLVEGHLETGMPGYRSLYSVEPRRTRLLLQALAQLSLLQRERVGLFMAPVYVGGACP